MSVTVEELLQLFDGADAELVREIHSEARGNRIECVSQLSAITGIEPQGMGSPEATSDSSSACAKSKKSASCATTEPRRIAILSSRFDHHPKCD